MGWLERWDRREQARAERDNVALGGDDWVERMDARTPGPAWAHALSAVPVIGLIGDLVVLLDARRMRRREREERAGG